MEKIEKERLKCFKNCDISVVGDEYIITQLKGLVFVFTIYSRIVICVVKLAIHYEGIPRHSFICRHIKKRLVR